MSEEVKEFNEKIAAGIDALPEPLRNLQAMMSAAYSNGATDMAAILTAAGKEDSPCPATDKAP